MRKLAQELAVVIPLGGTTSAEIDLENPDGLDPELRAHAIAMPADFTGTGLTFLVYNRILGTWLPMYDDAGTIYPVVVAADRHIVLDPTSFSAVSLFKIVSNDTEVAERTISLVLRRA